MGEASKKPDWFPAYVPRFLASDTILRMSTEAVGAYFFLLLRAWHQEPPGTVPDDDSVLASWARLSLSRWKRVREDVLRAFVKGEDGRWHQLTMKTIAAKSYSLMEQRRQAGKASANARSTVVEHPLNDRATNRVVVLLPSESNTRDSENTTTPPVERPLNDRSTTVDTAGVIDERLVVLGDVGISFGVAQKLIREHNTPLETLRAYAEMSLEGTVNNRAAFVRAAIAGGYAPKQVGPRFVPDDDAAIREGRADAQRRRDAKATGAKR